MKCPLCQKGIKPDCVLVPYAKSDMNKEYELDNLQGHLLWSHAQIEVVRLLMEKIKNEIFFL
jgi:hypothetical protein